MGLRHIKVSISGVKIMKIRLFIFFQSTVLTLLIFGCTQHPVDRSMRGWDHMMGYGGYGGMFMWLILIIFVGVTVYFILERSKRAGDSEDSTRETPTEILKRRYAKGEITKEEFDRLKKEIEN